MEFLDKRGALKTELLFEETIVTARRETYTPLYTLRENEHKGYPSAYKIYMSSVDEYEAAHKMLGSQRHWRRLCGLSWFMNGIPERGFEGVNSWRKDMLMRDQSLAKRQLKDAAESGVTSAQRALYLNTVAPKDARAPVGRPHKADTSEDRRNDKIAEIFGAINKA